MRRFFKRFSTAAASKPKLEAEPIPAQVTAEAGFEHPPSIIDQFKQPKSMNYAFQNQVLSRLINSLFL